MSLEGFSLMTLCWGCFSTVPPNAWRQDDSHTVVMGVNEDS